MTREARLPGLAEWARVRDWRLHMIGKLRNVEVFSGSRMEVDDVLATEARHVLVATGSLWRTDARGRSHPRGIGCAGDPRTLSPDAAMSGTRPAAGPVVIYDDDHYHIAAGLADLLATEGHAVTYVTPAGVVAEWAGYTVEQSRLHARLIERSVTIVTGHTIARLVPGGVRLGCVHTGREREIDCGAFVPVTSREPQDALWMSLQDHGLATLARIGDARAPGLIAHAVHDGHAAARSHLSSPAPYRRERPILKR